ncbi:MAG: pyruvate:ferredoxin (flavodoxin) oxidoreductase [Clostridia bacterium]|nr:pyruvate:ferredoxin (flavodoxin) oxidoreductase [Clostridia bacterium]
MKGNAAAAYVSYAFTEVAAIYPITPSSDMAEETDQMAARGVKNIFGQVVRVQEMQSEGGAAGAVHGSLAAGALTTTYTASQGLLLMIPNMYKIAGELLPCVIDVSARNVATHALNIYGEHSDVYACRQTGFAILASSSVQEVMDLGAVAHLSTIKSRVPFVHFFDGFRTSHEIQKIRVWDYDTLKGMVDFDAIDDFRRRALNPEHPVLRGSAQNPDIYFQARESSNVYYDKVPGIVEDYMKQVNKAIGTDYKPFNYYGAKDAEHVIVAMGSVCETAGEVVDYLNANGEKVGLVKVRLYRPFSPKHLIAALPKTVKTISVLDRTKEAGALGEPLWLDVVAALRNSAFKDVPVYGGRYGLGSKDTGPAYIVAVYRNAQSKKPKERFTIGIEDDVTKLSLKVRENPDTAPAGTHSCKFWGLGSDGTVGANQNTIKIIGDNTDMYAQGYFAYDSKKSGGLTVSHLRFGKNPIHSTYLISQADFVACHNTSYVYKYNIVEDIKPGGTFLLNCQWTPEELDEKLPAHVKRYLAKNKIKFYTLNAVAIDKELGLRGRINTVLQSAFFKLTGLIPEAEAIRLMKEAAYKSYYKKGDDVVQMNYNAIDRGANAVVEVPVPAKWAKCVDEPVETVIETDRPEMAKFVKEILIPVNEQKGDKLPVSIFSDRPDGTFPQGSAAFEKRGVAVQVPVWNGDNCIQCTLCSYVCPHACLRPVALTEKEAANVPEGNKPADMMQMPGYKFVMSVSALDCLGCGSCVNVCPGKKGNKALTMAMLDTATYQQPMFDLGVKMGEKEEVLAKFDDTKIKGSQFRTPLFEFSGACGGCGETPYAKLATQLFGDRMMIANATGCSSIWGGSAPSTPYTVNKQGKGPAWANSLFEDNAEFGYGMFLANKQIRERLAADVAVIAEKTRSAELKAACEEYLATADDSKTNKAPAEKLAALLKAKKLGGEAQAAADDILKDADFLAKKSQWILGGDGWAYDIGFGGLDHVLAQNEDVNILVFDTEVYSNTGGQASKSTPVGAVAKFAATGKSVKKKDLAQIAMTYGYVYVAQVAIGADPNQCLKAFHEAESYKGPSIIIAYAPCINHGIKKGLAVGIEEEKKAVAAGYWNNFRFDPRLAAEGKNPLTIDSKAPSASYRDFLMGEARYSSLVKTFPDRAENLFARAEANAADKYEHLLKLKAMYEAE